MHAVRELPGAGEITFMHPETAALVTPMSSGRTNRPSQAVKAKSGRDQSSRRGRPQRGVSAQTTTQRKDEGEPCGESSACILGQKAVIRDERKTVRRSPRSSPGAG